MTTDNAQNDWAGSSKIREQIKVLGNVHLLDMAEYQAKDLLGQLEQITQDFLRVYKLLAAHRTAQTEGVMRLLQYFPLNEYAQIDPNRANTLGRMAEQIARECGADDSMSTLLRYAVPMCDPDRADIDSDIEKLLRITREIIRHVNENYDGTGFPNQLKQEKIPLSARIATVVQGFYTYISPKPFGYEMSHEDALETMRKNDGFRYDPEVLNGLARVIYINDADPAQEMASTF